MSGENQSRPVALFERVHHIGINVANLDRSIEFYSDLFNVRPLFVYDMRGEALARGTGIENPDLQFCLMKISNVILEIIGFRTPDNPSPKAEVPGVGGFHIAFEVDDIEAAHTRLMDRGIETIASPHRFNADDESPAMIGASFAFYFGSRRHQPRDLSKALAIQ